MATETKKTGKSRAKKSSGYSYVGTTSDGVKLIRPKMKATNFTSKEIRETIARVIATPSVKK